MVAEPVQATLQVLNSLYNQTSNFIATQHDKINISEYIDKLSDLNPFISDYSDRHMAISRQSNSLSDKLCIKFNENKIKYISIFSIGIGVSSFWYYNQIYKQIQFQKSVKPKRRVPKLANGARRDVLLIVGSPTEPFTRLIALDFEKRGFIVYLTILDDKDFKYIESNPITDDINYLNLNESTFSFEVQLTRFQHLLEVPVIPFPGADSHNLRLAAVVFAPSLYFPIGPIENITIASWNKLSEGFLIYLKLFSSGLINLIRIQQSKVILINANIISSLDMPYHAPESLFQNGLKHLFSSLTREINQHGLSVTQVKLGNLHISNTINSTGKISNIINSEIRSWNEDIKDLYATDFSKSQFKANPIKSPGRGTSLRELYHLLFDLIYSKSKNPSVVYCGTGARTYDWISRIFPDSIIEWFLK